MNDVVKSDPFDVAIAAIEQSLPPEFRFEVDSHMFKDLMSLEEAHRVSRTMEAFKARVMNMGYTVDIWHDYVHHRWLYHLLRPGAPNTMGRTFGTPAK